MSLLGAAGISAASGIVGNLIGLGSSYLNNQWASELASQDRAENYMYNEKAAQKADIRTRALYNDFYSPEAIMRQYKAAGLSPSLMFGGTPGQGGVTGAQGSGSSGTQTHFTPFMPTSMLEAAQTALIAAETQKTKEETKNISTLANATVSSLLAEAGYKNASAAAAKAQATGIELDNYIKENTKDASVFMICEKAEQAGYEAKQAYYAMKDAKLLNQFNQDTFEDRKKIVHEELNQLVQSIAESKTTAALNIQQKQYLKDQILQNISNTMLEWNKYELSTEQFETFLEKQIPILEKELEISLKDLDIKKRQMVINAITDTFKSLAMGAMAASSMGIGKGGNLSPAKPKPDLGKVKYDPYKPKTYQTNTVWSF